MLKGMSDAELCAATGAGRSAAFVELVKRYQGAVCAVTWALTGRRDVSEDLAQETFVIAWNKLPQLQSPDRVGPWLTGIARNLGRKAVRDARTVPLVEEHVAHSDETGLESAVARQQEQQRLRQWLDSLPDTIREAMVLHYREGLAAPRVAELLGISVAAAEQRLSRGRKQLRDKAERAVRAELHRTRPNERFTRRVAAALPLSPALAPAAKTSTGALTHSVLSGIAMNKLIVALFAIAALVVLGYTLREPEATTESSPSVEASQTDPHRAAQGSTTQPPQTGVITGRVSAAEGGAAVPGAAVVIADRDGQVALTHRGGAVGLAIARVGADGRWRVTGLSPGVYRASATAPGHRPAARDDVELADFPLEGVDLELVAGGHVVSGLVTDIVGGPIEGAMVHAKSRGTVATAALTDAQGRYALSLASGDHLVSAWEASYQGARSQVTVADVDRVLDLTLVPGASISGRVVDRHSGEPVAGAAVSFGLVNTLGAFRSSRAARRDERTISDAQGRFTLRQLAAASYQISATASQRATLAPTELDVAIAEQLSDVVVFVDPAHDVRGRVVDRARPDVGIAGVEVNVWGSGGAPAVRTLTDATGAFALLGVLDGERTVALRGEGFVPSVSETLTIGGADIDGHRFEVDVGSTLQGVVEPAGAVELRIELSGNRDGMAMLRMRPRLKNAVARSSDDGAFVLRNVPHGTWRLVAEGDDGSYGESPIEVDGPRGGLSVALESRPFVSGRLVDGRGTPVPETAVELTEATDADPKSYEAMVAASGARTTTTGPDGGFSFVGLRPGTFELTAHGRDGTPWTMADGGSGRRVEVASAPMSDVVLAVRRPTDTIRGRVLGADRAPLADAWVTLVGKDAPPLETARPPTITDADGQFEFAAVARGEYTVHVTSAHGDARGTEEGVTEGANLELVLESLGRIEGRVTAGGRAVQQFDVELVGSLFDRTFITEDGRFEVGRIEAGQAVLLVTAAEGSARVPMTVAAGQGTPAEIELKRWGSVRGRAVDDSGEPMPGVLIDFVAAGGDRDAAARMAGRFSGETLTTDAEGRFAFDGIGGGVVSMRLSTGPQYSRDSVPRGGVLARVEAGRDNDLGDVRVLSGDVVSEEDRGTLGLEVNPKVAIPGTDGGPPQEDVPDAEPAVWIGAVHPRGPAAAAGLTSGTRVLAVDGVSAADAGPMLLEAMLSACRVRRGQSYSLTVATDEGAREVTLVAAEPPRRPFGL